MGKSSTIWCILFTVVYLFLIGGVPLLLVFAGSRPKAPTFSVESSTVKAYNLTSDKDRQLFCIINLGVRVHNPNPRKYWFGFSGIDVEVRKGNHHNLAGDAISEFDVGPGGDALVTVEAVGLHVALERKIAREVRADAAAGEGRVNVYMTGKVESDKLGATCKDVAVDFSRSTVRVQKVDCGVSVTLISSARRWGWIAWIVLVLIPTLMVIERFLRGSD